MPLVILTMNRVFRRRRLAYVSNKILERTSPPITDFNSTATIILKVYSPRIITAVQHISPATVKGVFIFHLTVLNSAQASFKCEPPATRGIGNQHSRSSLQFPCIAFQSRIFRDSNNNDPPLSVVNQVMPSPEGVNRLLRSIDGTTQGDRPANDPLRQEFLSIGDKDINLRSYK